jgi:hypothetical protein
MYRTSESSKKLRLELRQLRGVRLCGSMPKMTLGVGDSTGWLPATVWVRALFSFGRSIQLYTFNADSLRGRQCFAGRGTCCEVRGLSRLQSNLSRGSSSPDGHWLTSPRPLSFHFLPVYTPPPSYTIAHLDLAENLAGHGFFTQIKCSEPPNIRLVGQSGLGHNGER